ncbi:2OG-Fe dioxygenase family protein [Luteimonas sp. BDR2-5]|uniref:2OG-Fe dioxygenase family protein n=1 Tax=Proluteimonas luteida TaxID=2878685 RepID=UPI001E569659|nr:2OG-Fe dioxygenase family protein [Luteimonas sp. BDR2-5]MCD9027295.1 2OG-Fe dioxygenase family protein [Luteimonas sp. BDR2-5]
MNAYPPPYSPVSSVVADLRTRGEAVVAPQDVAALCGIPLADLDALRPSWDELPEDGYLKDGGRYRRRRHSCFVQDGGDLRQIPHRAHWQSVDYNALHGGMHRWFEPIQADIVARPVWSRLLVGLGEVFAQVHPRAPWYIEAHQFRIDTTDGIGRPTPEGAHRDGVDFVAVLLVGRRGIKGGETRVFEADGPNGQRFTLTEPWSLLLLDDARVIHESTPIQPVDGEGHRDTLVLTYRSGAFQGED